LSRRIVAGIAVWALTVFGAVRLFHDVAAPVAGGTVALLAGALGAAAWSRRPRPVSLSSMPDVASAPELPAGPRRVLLVEAGMTGPE
jgi:hypothetical protein